MWCALILTLALGLREATPNQAFTVAWDLPDGAQVKSVHLLADRHSAAIIVDDAPGVVEPLVRASLGSLEVEETPLDGGRLYVLVTAARTLADAVIVRANKRQRVEFRVDTPRDLAQRHLATRLPRTVPSIFQGQRFQLAESLLVHGRLRDAAAAYRGLTREYAVQYWVRLRLADLAWMQGETQQACADYRAISQEHADRTVSQMAKLHLGLAECPGAPAIVDLVASVSAGVIDDAVSEYLWGETMAFAVESENDVAVQAAIAAVARIPTHRRIVPTIRDAETALLSRLVYAPATPWVRAQRCLESREALRLSSERAPLRLACAESLLRLELPRESLAMVESLTSHGNSTVQPLWQAVALPSRLLAVETRARKAISGGDSSSRAAALVDAAEPRPTDDLVARLADARERLFLVEQKLRGLNRDGSGVQP